MTARDLYEKYKDIFILVMENAGEETGNEEGCDIMIQPQ